MVGVRLVGVVVVRLVGVVDVRLVGVVDVRLVGVVGVKVSFLKRKETLVGRRQESDVVSPPTPVDSTTSHVCHGVKDGQFHHQDTNYEHLSPPFSNRRLSCRVHRGVPRHLWDEDKDGLGQGKTDVPPTRVLSRQLPCGVWSSCKQYRLGTEVEPSSFWTRPSILVKPCP